MKRLFPLLLSLLLLCGCAAQNPGIETTAAADTAAAPDESPVRDTLAMALQSESQALRQYSLTEEVTGILPLGENLLFFSGGDAATLTLLDPDTGESIAVHEAPIALSPESNALQLLEGGISYFDSSQARTLVLDTTLREIRSIAAPEDLTGTPLLSNDRRTLYYCTPTAVRALDLDSGISRILKEAAYPAQSVAGLLLGDTVLEVSITDAGRTGRSLFLSCETGQLLGEYEGTILPETTLDRFFLCLRQGSLNTLLFGGAGEPPVTLNTLNEVEDCFFLGQQVVTASRLGDAVCMELYDLDSGLRTSCLSLLPGQSPRSMVMDTEGCFWFLCDQEDGPVLLCRWDSAATRIQDNTVYTASYYTRQEPDYEGLAACSLYAQEISAKYGVEVLIYKDAVAVEPWDYHLEYEYQPTVLRRELEALDQRLGNYPPGFFQTMAAKFTALRICIVRSVSGSPESGSLAAVNGVQFWENYDAYIVLASDHNTERALYHEVCHLIETVVLTESTAYDQWEALNPSDFQYDYDYVTNQTRDGSPWLQPGKEMFIDTYSMSFPKEDRARIMEYAMTAGNADLFRSPYLQAKLLRLSTGIREAFGLEKSEETFLWEQYLYLQ